LKNVAVINEKHALVRSIYHSHSIPKTHT